MTESLPGPKQRKRSERSPSQTTAAIPNRENRQMVMAARMWRSIEFWRMLRAAPLNSRMAGQ